MVVRPGVADRGEGINAGNAPATPLRRWRREFVDIRHMDRRTSRRMRTESRVPKLEGSARGEPPPFQVPFSVLRVRLNFGKLKIRFLNLLILNVDYTYNKRWKELDERFQMSYH